MAYPVYSYRFALVDVPSASAPVEVVYTVPSGCVAALGAIDLVSQVSGASQYLDVYLYSPASGTFATVWQWASDGEAVQVAEWRTRQVAFAGDEFIFYAQGEYVEFAASGYLFTGAPPAAMTQGAVQVSEEASRVRSRRRQPTHPTR